MVEQIGSISRGIRTFPDGRSKLAKPYKKKPQKRQHKREKRLWEIGIARRAWLPLQI